MPLLTTANLLTYAPNLPPASATDAVINAAEMLAYGPNGSGYDLELTTRVETKYLSMANEVIPTWRIANLTTVIVDARSARIDNEWHRLEADSVEITATRVRVKSDLFGSLFHGSRDFGRRRFYVDRPLAGHAYSELRINYQSGIDFSVDTPEVRRLRSALAGIVMAQYAAAKGLSQLTTSSTAPAASGQKIVSKSVLAGRAAIEYSNPKTAAETSTRMMQVGSSSGSINGAIDDCLAVFRQYQPRPIVG